MNKTIAICASTLIMWCTDVQAESLHIQGGLTICIGAEALGSVADDWGKPGCVFHCLETSDAEIARLRKKIHAAGCYGKVSVAQFDGKRLPYINNLVNLVVIRETRFKIPAEEVERVLAPYGTAIAPEDSSCIATPALRIGDGYVEVSDGTDYYCIFGMPVNRGETFNPRNGYALIARAKSADAWTSKWAVRIRITGKAMVLAGDTVFVAGAPLVFHRNDLGATYAGRLGGILWATSAADETKLAEYKLDVLPAWDGMAAAYGRLFIVNQDGSIECWGADSNSGAP